MSPSMTPVAAGGAGLERTRFDSERRSASFDLASASSMMGSVYGDDRDGASVDSLDTSQKRAASPAPRSERRWKVRQRVVAVAMAL